MYKWITQQAAVPCAANSKRWLQTAGSEQCCNGTCDSINKYTTLL